MEGQKITSFSWKREIDRVEMGGSIIIKDDILYVGRRAGDHFAYNHIVMYDILQQRIIGEKNIEFVRIVLDRHDAIIVSSDSDPMYPNTLQKLSVLNGEEKNGHICWSSHSLCSNPSEIYNHFNDYGRWRSSQKIYTFRRN